MAGNRCFYCGNSPVAILGRELEKEGYKIVFQIFVCKKHYREWFVEKTKEGFK